MQVLLNTAERKVIRHIMKIQLESLKSLLKGDTAEDLVMWCLEVDTTRETLNEVIRRHMENYRHVFFNPHEFLNLSEDELSICKHILHRHLSKVKLPEAKTSIWRKMVRFDSFLLTFNPN